MLVSGAIVALAVIYFILAFFFKLPPFSKEEEETEKEKEVESTTLTSPVTLNSMNISASTEDESETSGYTMTSYYDINNINPLLEFKVDFNVPNDSAVIYINEWHIFGMLDTNILFSTVITKDPNNTDDTNFTRNGSATTGMLNLSTSALSYDLDNLLSNVSNEFKILILYKTIYSNKVYDAIHIDADPVDNVAEFYNSPGKILDNSVFDRSNFITSLNRLTAGEISEFSDEIVINIEKGVDESDVSLDFISDEIDENQTYQLYVKKSADDDDDDAEEVSDSNDKLLRTGPYEFRPSGVTDQNNYKYNRFKIVSETQNKNVLADTSGSPRFQFFKYANHPIYPGFITFFGRVDDVDSGNLKYLKLRKPDTTENNHGGYSTTENLSDFRTAFQIFNSNETKLILPEINYQELLQTIDVTNYYGFKGRLQQLVDYIKEENINFGQLLNILKIYTLGSTISTTQNRLAFISIKRLNSDNSIDLIRYYKGNNSNSNKMTEMFLGSDIQLQQAFAFTDKDFIEKILGTLTDTDFTIAYNTIPMNVRFFKEDDNDIDIMTATNLIYNRSIKTYTKNEKVFDNITDIIIPIVKTS